MENVIEIKNLYKNYGEVKAVSDLSFKVKKGELFAFLGVNGAGKSTTISMMCGTLKKDSGKIYIGGEDIDYKSDDVKKKIGVVFQNSALDKALSVKDNLLHRASLYGIVGEEFNNRLNELSQMLDFKDILNRPVGKLSGGQRRKVDIARALVHKPMILVLDEPTTGLDPQTRSTLWQAVEKMRKDFGMTVLLTTHYMEEAADADYVVIIDSGKISAEGTPHELKNKYASDSITIYNVLEEDVKKLNLPYVAVAGGYRIEVQSTKEATRLITENPTLFEDYETVKGKMDSVFLTVTGKKLSEDK